MKEPIHPSTKAVTLSIFASAAVLGTYVLLRFLEIPAGEVVDWLVAVAGFWWLLGIVTIPWNIHFAARRVAYEIETSRRRDLLIERSDRAYVRQAARRSLAIAVLLHGLSAIAFAALAWFGLSVVGWFASGAALALTLFRPSVRLCRHVIARLGEIGRRARYPRDDVRTVLEKIGRHETRLDDLAFALDVSEPASWATRIEERLERLDQRVEAVRVVHEMHEQRNDDEHRRLSRAAEQAVERLGEDSQFLGNVREIIRFVKDA